jgi:hypothetical protein
MSKRLSAAAIVLAVVILSALARFRTAPPRSGPAKNQEAIQAAGAAQGGSAPVDFDGWGRPIVPPAGGQKPSPPPPRDISGIWDPGDGGIQALGASAMPDDGRPEHHVSYTPGGLKAWKETKPSNGTRSFLPAETNDPIIAGDPQGFPREDLYELLTTQILQTPLRTVVLYEFGKIWRVIWTDGRDFPKDPEPRWYGYSVGKWVDDSTLVVQTWGIDERSWLDHVGRPHSADLRVEERFHRVDQDDLELTVTINDPQMYEKPWVALDKLSFSLQAPTFDVREMIWSPSEFAAYDKLIGGRMSDKDRK